MNSTQIGRMLVKLVVNQSLVMMTSRITQVGILAICIQHIPKLGHVRCYYVNRMANNVGNKYNLLVLL